MLKKFRLWESEIDSMKSKEFVIAQIKSALGEKVYVVPNFKEIVKEGEPHQMVTLCMLQDGHSFALNFAGKELYSVDFWTPDSTKPVGTLYVSSRGLSVADAIDAIPKLLKNPSAEVVESLHEFEKKITLEKPKAPKDVITDPGARKVQSDIAKATTSAQGEPYTFQDKNTIFNDFRQYLRMVIKGKWDAFLCTGMAGIGKDFITNDEIKKAGLEKDRDWVKIRGKSSAASMYIALYKNNGKLIVFSDCDSVFKDEDGINTLKGALESDAAEREITWGVARPIKDPETNEKVPTKFLFTGRVIFLSNIAMKNPVLNKIDAVKSRSMVLEVALSPEDMLAYVEEMLPVVQPKTPLATKKMAMNTIKSVGKSNPEVKLNMRTLLKAIAILEEIDDITVAKRMIVQQCAY